MIKKFMIGSVAIKTVLLLLSITAFVFVLATPADAQETEVPKIVAVETETDNSMKYLGAAIAVSVGSIAGGVAVAVVGAAALGAVTERPELKGMALVFVGLAEGIAIYGVAIAVLILVL